MSDDAVEPHLHRCKQWECTGECEPEEDARLDLNHGGCVCECGAILHAFPPHETGNWHGDWAWRLPDGSWAVFPHRGEPPFGAE